ncbi:anti-sigma factor family protein [Algihabitans albus]|uniref:anti-sigma factor family protein n=1 Tax=Algihabitans albus TaxID=2164067 RepID=UPI000E5C93CC|nr:hypothetical protein [Algihabitans albus]
MSDMGAQLSDERLVAYADGELPEQEAFEIEQALMENPAAGARLRALVEAGEMARLAFAAITEEPVPERLRAAIMDAPTAMNAPTSADEPAATPAEDGADNVVRLPRRQNRQQTVWRPVALAASLAVAVAAGVFAWLPGGENGQTGNGLAPQLAAALSQTPSYEPIQLADGELTVLGSFRSQDNRFCREFERLSDGGGERGLVCRSGPQADWQMVAGSSIPPAATTETGSFRPAGAGDEDPVAAAVDRLQAGPVLSADEEQRELGL